MSYKVRFASNIAVIGREAWDELAGEEIFANYGWLRTLESNQRQQRKPFYWWIEDEKGIVVAVAARLRNPGPPAWNIDRGRYGLMAYVIRPIRELVQRRPMLVCGGQMAPSQPIITRSGLTAEEYHLLAEKIVDAIESYCRAQGWYLVFRGIVEPDEALRRVFADRPYIEAAESPGTVMDIRWNSWHDYLKNLKNTHPSTEKGIRVQTNRGRRGGVVIEELIDPSTVEADLYRILAEHHFRKNRTPFYMDPQFMTVLKNSLGDRAVILVARKDDRIVGISIYLRNSSAMQLKFVGIAADTVKSREAVYFNITYHELIRRACEEGFERLYLGILTYEPKCRRGARLVPTSSWIWQPGHLRALMLRLILSYQARRQERRLAPFATQNQAGEEIVLPPYRWPQHPKTRN